MKSEHRHELKTNELERIASHWSHASERYVQEHTYQLVLAAVVVVAAGIGALYWSQSGKAVERRGWQALLDAGSPSDYGNVADKYAGTEVGAWARLREAEAEYYSAVRLMFTDGDAGRSEMKKAQEHFEKLVADKSTPKSVLQRALFGLAQTREALPEKGVPASKINDRAIEMYERLLNSKEFDELIYKQLAESRIEALRTGTAQSFYAWFETQNPKPADRELPKDLVVPPPPQPPDTSGAPSKGKAAENKPEGKSAKTPASHAPAVPQSGRSDSKAKSSQSAPPAGPTFPAPPR